MAAIMPGEMDTGQGPWMVIDGCRAHGKKEIKDRIGNPAAGENNFFQIDNVHSTLNSGNSQVFFWKARVYSIN